MTTYIKPSNRLKSWAEMRDDQVLVNGEWRPRLGEVVLKKESFLTEVKLESLQYRYYNGDIPLPPIERDTLFWYEPGRRHSKGRGRHSKGRGRHSKGPEIAGIYLKGVIPKDIQETAYDALHSMKWEKPKTRPETKTAIYRQRGKGRVAAKELHFGYTNWITIELSTVARKQREQFIRLGSLLRCMDKIFKITLPNQWYAQNTPKSMEEREQEYQEVVAKKKKHAEYGGIPFRFRQLLTCFSNVTMLKSCPASIHQDRNARGDQENFACLTSIRGKEDFKGGTFCLLEYGIKIPVRPGDILICQSTKDWHTNIGPVEGLKYSIVTYYKAVLPAPSYTIGGSAGVETHGMRMLDEMMARGPVEKANLLVRGLSKLKSKGREKTNG